jgi:hypothetical protein
MKKDEANITEKERQEARRRIEGSLAPDMDSMNLGIGDLPENTDVADAAAHGGFSAGTGGMSHLHPANLS